MNKDEAEQIIRDFVKPKPIKYWYDDPYKDGNLIAVDGYMNILL